MQDSYLTECNDLARRLKDGLARVRAANRRNGCAGGAVSAALQRKRTLRLARRLKPVLEEIYEDGEGGSLNAIARALNRRGFKTTKGNDWTHRTVKVLLGRVKSML